ncbi:hypothetical protein PFICI_10291 [Pestalotiopsis fici W106-1]|uniref:F-box domain-containing protein n=1 Tax=Pestalotiopsis fici (strain W106-1 / CGMCC3.15140) TaxID=1229662 RepID=W3WWS6_PESFW|nr:uncharacterized protein PFICI_10291 [Pestalotiopsis fici W106-1]ETS78229.1 hypothetical protein PFICI_10291 [Pestalotiopsis fici W106-1]
MGGFDVYCVVCGSAMYREVVQDEGYDQAITNTEDTAWVGNTVVISENPDARAASKVFISGQANVQDCGYFDFVSGEDPDPNFPDGPTCWQVYERDGENPYAVPIHTSCLELFKKVLQPKDLDKEILYEILKCLGPEPILPIDYGAVTEGQDQYWVTMEGMEEFVIDPEIVPRLRQYYSEFPAADKSGLARPGLPSRQTSSHDPFKRVPPEVMLFIFQHLDWHSINQFRASSRQAAQLELSNRYWSSRLYQDMPWLYDIPLEMWKGKFQFPDDLDWTKIYRDLYLSSDTESKAKIHGLVNRRRIWGICQQIADFYNERDLGLKNGTITEVMQEVQSTPLKQLVYPDPMIITKRQTFIISWYADMEHSTPALSIHWTQKGELAKLDTIEPESEGPSPLRDDICIPEGDWITGFIVYSVDAEREHRKDAVRYFTCGLEILFAKRDSIKLRKTANSNQRLLLVSPNHFLVGFAAHMSEDGLIAKLALLEQPKAKMPFRSEYRVVEHHARLEDNAAKHLWSGDLPSPTLGFKGLWRGYWSASKMNDENLPLEALVFGDCESELCDITSIGADVHFGRFEVHYGNRAPRAIGPRGYAMQYIDIDGHGGERVIHVYWSVSHIPTGCRLVTNRGRQLIVGQPSDDERAFRSHEQGDGNNRTLAGIVGYWSNRLLPQANLSAVGVLVCHDVHVQSHQRPHRDTNNFFWTPEQPPNGIIEAGPIWGQREVYDQWQRRHKKYPSSKTVVSWLDCQQPVDEVRVTLCHSTRTRQLPLAAITLVQDNVATEPWPRTIGAERFSQPSDTTGTKGHHWCWCALGSRQDTELETRPHHVHEIWPVGGQKLKSMRVWLNENEGITGFQLVAMDDTESPAWGHCEETPSAEIGFVAGSGPGAAETPAVGVKFFLDNNERQVTRDDIIVTAVQALVKT